MSIFSTAALSVSGAFAGISLLALPIWLVGVPGVGGSYAKGWKIGLFALILYPAIWLVSFTVWRVQRRQISSEILSDFDFWVGTGSLCILAVSAAVVVYAFRVMSRK